jgi:hypothetical protein
MLNILEEREDKMRAQAKLDELIKRSWRKHERRLIVWRPNRRDLTIAHNDHLWFAAVRPSRDQKIKRYWNSFGAYSATGNLFISVEINIPTESNSRTVSGFFALDPITKVIYLMHDGGLGGGQKGVGQTEFLNWSGDKPVPAYDSQGGVRIGFIVAALEGPSAVQSISRFVEKVISFKQAVRDGQVASQSPAQGTGHSYGDYFKEFSGTKKGQRKKEFEYISRHGDVVDELTRWRPASKKKGERIVKNGLIDLGIEVRRKLVALFEVKTNASRQSLYTAIGQLAVHGKGDRDLERYVVVPASDKIPADVARCLDELDIQVLRYTLKPKAVGIRAG